MLFPTAKFSSTLIQTFNILRVTQSRNCMIDTNQYTSTTFTTSRKKHMEQRDLQPSSTLPSMIERLFQGSVSIALSITWWRKWMSMSYRFKHNITQVNWNNLLITKLSKKTFIKRCSSITQCYMELRVLKSHRNGVTLRWPQVVQLKSLIRRISFSNKIGKCVF
jgi:hypothetical protein